MLINAIEGVVENGTIRLQENVLLPDKTKVYVIVANDRDADIPQLRSPRLADPKQAANFRKQVLEIGTNAKL